MPDIALVISSRSDVAGVEKAKAAGLNLKIVRRKGLSRYRIVQQSHCGRIKGRQRRSCCAGGLAVPVAYT